MTWIVPQAATLRGPAEPSLQLRSQACSPGTSRHQLGPMHTDAHGSACPLFPPCVSSLCISTGLLAAPPNGISLLLAFSLAHLYVFCLCVARLKKKKKNGPVPHASGRKASIFNSRKKVESLPQPLSGAFQSLASADRAPGKPPVPSSMCPHFGSQATALRLSQLGPSSRLLPRERGSSLPLPCSPWPREWIPVSLEVHFPAHSFPSFSHSTPLGLIFPSVQNGC